MDLATIKKAAKGVLGPGSNRKDGESELGPATIERRQKASWNLATIEKAAKDVLGPGNNRKGGKCVLGLGNNRKGGYRRAGTWQQ